MANTYRQVGNLLYCRRPWRRCKLTRSQPGVAQALIEGQQKHPSHQGTSPTHAGRTLYRLQGTHTVSPTCPRWQTGWRRELKSHFALNTINLLTFDTLIWLVVRVPVLSEQMTLVPPKVSTLGRFRTMAFFWAIFLVPRARHAVMTAAKPSGIAATARATAILK